MKIIDNITSRLGEDLKAEIKKGSKLSIAASSFSIYAFEALKKELKGIDELEFIFTSPTFIEDLLQKGADVNAWTCNGEQALKHAFFAKKHAKEYMKLLLQYGATIDETQIRDPYQLERFRRVIAELKMN